MSRLLQPRSYFIGDFVVHEPKSKNYLAACIQLCSNEDVQANLSRVEALIERAAGYGASLVATPENTPFLGAQFHKVDLAQPLDGSIMSGFSEIAKRLGIHLLIGSFAEQKRFETGEVDPHRCYNTSVLFGPSGARLNVYRKIHLFDVDVPGGLCVKESDTIAPGDAIEVAQTPLGDLGLSICYDLRFAELYQAQIRRGAEVLMVPSAFTLTTGKDHWHALLKTRAIENGAYVLAPAQWGTHDEAGLRKSYGHSVIIDPWGTVIAEASDGEGLCCAEIELDRVERVRSAIPVQANRRLEWGIR